jgi:uncharacterized membrane protein YecN with MAPEG domain
MAATSMVASIQTILAYAAVVGLIFIGLSILTIAERRKASVYLGAGDNDRLLRRIRAHANFAEYVPLALILIAGVAITGAPPWFVNASCALLVAGRLLHATAILRSDGRLRIAGMAATLTVIGATALFNLIAIALI